MANVKHHMYGTRTYKSWSEMKQRCGDAKRKYWENINYCKEWEEFENFYKDMGERPLNTSLDRIDGTKGYYKENCRWADRKTQNNNLKSNTKFNYNNENLTIPQLARKYNISRSNLANKIYIYKMNIDEAMNYLLMKRRNDL